MNHLLPLLKSAFDRLEAQFSALGEFTHPLTVDFERIQSLFSGYLDRLALSYPFGHPAYAGQMLKPPHEAAWLAYAAAMLVNPNNHALDGGPETSRMEKEVVDALASFYRFPTASLGHLTASGTIANLEAHWVARNEHPGKGVIFSKSAHYNHERMCSVLGMKFYALDYEAPDLHDRIRELAPEVGTLVATMGTTALGRVEPLAELLPLCRELGIRVHVDTAYGGFFHGLRNSGLIDPTHWNVLGEVDSLVVDPHKHGLQPYGCGCVLFRDPKVGRFYKHDSPFTYFTSDELHLGEISLECSRAGSAAAALWFTLQVLPLEGDDGLMKILKVCREAALDFAERLDQSPLWQLLERPTLDIVAYYPTPQGASMSDISRRCKQILMSGMEVEPENRVYLSLYAVPSEIVAKRHPELEIDTDRVSILRSVLMKPSHKDYVPELLNRLDRLAALVG